jgi:ATP-binding cassette subfamily F protein 3
VIHIEQLSIHLGGRYLLQNAQCKIYPGQKVGLIGANGAGKSTLFKLLLGEITPNTGHCAIPSRWEIALIPQSLPHGTITPLEYILAGDTLYQSTMVTLARAELEEDAMGIANAHDTLHTIDGYRAPAKAAYLLKGLGFLDSQMHDPIDSFSGGWRMRLNLAKTLMARADLFLLDEPTNHLDLDAIVWLEDWVKQCQATVVVITHDAAFLDAVPEYILALENQQLTLYTGNYSSYLVQKTSQLALQQAAIDKQQKVRAHLEGFVNRFRAKASKAKQAQSRMKALEKLPLLAAIQEKSEFHFEFSAETADCPNPVIRLEKIAFSYPNCPAIFQKLNFLISPGDRIALLGLNGAGKSTFMKLLAGSETPQNGIRTLGGGLRIGYFAQEQAESFEEHLTPLRWFQQQLPNQNERMLRGYLGRFAFSDTRALQPISTLSGGERARLALAWIIWQKPHLLLLDEPTNHLDLDMRQALILALQTFTGAMVLVSHDRQLITQTADDLWWVHQGLVQRFVGDMQDYTKQLRQQRNAAS